MKQVLIMVPCSTDMQENLIKRFEDKYDFVFAYGDHALIEKWLPSVEIIIGEPDEEQISLAQNLKWIQLTWAGTDKYDRMTNLPSDLCITNASGAFGKIISEYAVGSIISIYRSFPKYWASKKDKLWERQDTATTIFGKTALVLGTGDIGKNVAHRLKAFDCNVLGIKRDVNIKPLADFDQLFKMDDLTVRQYIHYANHLNSAIILLLVGIYSVFEFEQFVQRCCFPTDRESADFGLFVTVWHFAVLQLGYSLFYFCFH